MDVSLLKSVRFVKWIPLRLPIDKGQRVDTIEIAEDALKVVGLVC